MSNLDSIKMDPGYYGKEETEDGVKGKWIVSLKYEGREIKVSYYMDEGEGRLGPYEAQIMRYLFLHEEDKVDYLLGEDKEVIRGLL